MPTGVPVEWLASMIGHHAADGALAMLAAAVDPAALDLDVKLVTLAAEAHPNCCSTSAKARCDTDALEVVASGKPRAFVRDRLGTMTTPRTPRVALPQARRSEPSGCRRCVHSGG